MLQSVFTDLCFLGYAVTAGHFSSPNTIDVAAGAPQDSGGGKVGGFSQCSEIASLLPGSVYITPMLTL